MWQRDLKVLLHKKKQIIILLTLITGLGVLLNNIKVTLEHTSESIAVLKRLNEQQPDRVFFGSDFKSGSLGKLTICNVCLDPGTKAMCNFTDINTGEQWFCYKPPELDCNTRYTHVKQGVSESKISKEELALFQSGINLRASIKASGNKTILILPQTGEQKEVKTGASGYYYRNHWLSLNGVIRPFDSAESITACLKGKQLRMFGDSTVRQYYEYITGKVKNILKFDKHSSTQVGPLVAIDHTNDILVSFRGHGPPFRSYKISLAQLRYVANELDRLDGGPNTVVVIGVWAHFPTFPLEVYYQRLVTIRKSVQRLLNRAPQTKIIIRTGNMKNQTPKGSLTDSDWYCYQIDRLLRTVFKDAGVVFLEAWEMVQAHYLPYNLHPQPEIIKLMIDYIMSNTCP